MKINHLAAVGFVGVVVVVDDADDVVIVDSIVAFYFDPSLRQRVVVQDRPTPSIVHTDRRRKFNFLSIEPHATSLLNSRRSEIVIRL